jgi:D-alanine-D-alanine ligase
MRTRVAIIYNEPRPSRYSHVGEEKAVLGVLDAVQAVHRALLQLDLDVIQVPLVPPLARARRKLRDVNADVVFNLFEGFSGHPETEALVPEILTQTGIPFTGCTGSMLRLALDKANVKAILKTAGIQTPDFQLLNPQMLHMFRLGYPCIVKPRCEHDSHGLSVKSVVSDFTALERQTRLVSSFFGGGALVEEFIDGQEFNATVLADSQCTVLPVSEIAYSLPSGMPRILTFAAKWDPDSLYFQGTNPVCPADVEADERKLIAETARTAFEVLGGKGYCRVDMRMDRDGQLKVTDVNPNPDISPGSGTARHAEAAGMTYNQFIETIVRLALDGENNENQYSPNELRRQSQHNGDATQYSRIQTL